MAGDASGSRTYRLVTAGLGLLFLVLAGAIIVESDRSLGQLLAAGVLGILGLDALVSAWRGRWSLLSRIGPWP